MQNRYEIATMDGDGIGPEVCQAAIRILKEACGASLLNFTAHEGGAGLYQRTGEVLPEDSFDACKAADAMLHGAAGLPARVSNVSRALHSIWHASARVRRAMADIA